MLAVIVIKRLGISPQLSKLRPPVYPSSRSN
jgi:hypothetical protein